MMAGPD